MGDRLERLGGEPAPAITPEEFERLQKAGQVHIDSRGRVRTARRSGAEAAYRCASAVPGMEAPDRRQLRLRRLERLRQSRVSADGIDVASFGATRRWLAPVKVSPRQKHART